MKICMLTSAHSPFDARVFHKEAKSLAKSGHHQVTIVAPSVGLAFKNAKADDIEIISLPKYRYKFLMRAITILQLLNRALAVKATVYHCHEFDIFLGSIILKLLLNAKIVYDVHEHFPAKVSEYPIFPSFSASIVRLLLEKIETLFCRFADQIFTVNSTLRRRFLGANKSTTVLYNCPFLKLYVPQKNQTMSRKYGNGKVVIYEGAVNRKRGIDKFLFALPEVKRKFSDIIFLVIGDIFCDAEVNTWINNYVASEKLDNNFKITGWIPYTELPEALANANVGVILFQPVSYNNFIGLPNKLFEYMACGIPVIACDFPEIRAVVEKSQCGILIDPTKPEAIADTIVYLLEHPQVAKAMGENGRKAVEKKYNWEKMEIRLLKDYEKLNTRTQFHECNEANNIFSNAEKKSKEVGDTTVIFSKGE